VADGQWHHVAATLDRRRLLLYVDGRLQTLSGAEDLQWDERLPENNLDLTIGCNSAEGDAFIGTIDESMVFDRALSSAEISRVYELTRAGASRR
jgi:hypothetical protein